MKTLRSIICSAVISVMVFVSVPAQSGGDFTITKSVIAGGGGHSEGGTFIVDGTIGQPFGGAASTGGTFSLQSGFWSPAAIPSPTPTFASIAGNIDYAIVSKPVPGVTLQAAGTPNGSTVTDGMGDYLLTNLGFGAYTVTPSRPTQACGTPNGIFSFDAALVARFVVNLTTFTPTQVEAAKVAGLGFVSSFDASLIARRVVGLCTAPNNFSGEFRFMPTSISYADLSVNRTEENYTAILMGDVNGDWSPAGLRPALVVDDPDAVQSSLPKVAAQAGSTIEVPLSINRLKGMGINAYQFDIEYDPDVLEPAEVAADISGTRSEGLSIVSNVPLAGLLKVAVYGAYPASGDGVWANLRFNVIGKPGTATPLSIREFRFNEGTTGVAVRDGHVEVTAGETLIRGRLVTPTGEPVVNASVVLTSTTGARREIKSTSLGYFEFGGLEMGQTYTVAVSSRRHTFAPVTVSVTRSITTLEMIAEHYGKLVIPKRRP